MSNRLAPAWRSASWTSGSSVSRRSRSPGMKLCGCRNCATPWRSQRPHASSGEPGGGSGSRSTTVTACPSRASSNALPSPQMPPPMMRTCANACLRSGIARRGRPVQLLPLVEDVEAKTARALAAPDALPPAEPQERAAVEPARELEGTLDDGTLALHFLLLDPERRFPRRAPAVDRCEGARRSSRPPVEGPRELRSGRRQLRRRSRSPSRTADEQQLPAAPLRAGVARLLRRNLGAGATSLRDADRDRLLPALALLARASGPEGPGLPLAHRLLDLARSLLAVCSRHARDPSGTDEGGNIQRAVVAAPPEGGHAPAMTGT